MIRLFQNARQNFGSATIASHQRSESASIGNADCARLVKENSTTRTNGDSRNTTKTPPIPRQTMLDSAAHRGRHCENRKIARSATADDEPSVTNDIAAPIGQLKMRPNWAAI